MEYKVSFSKPGNHFFFTANFSEWHFSCRHPYNKKWQELLGPLTNSEKQNLVKFSKIMKNFGFKEVQPGVLNFLGSAFITSQNKKEAYNKLLAEISKQEVNVIQKTINLMEDKFNTWWKETENTLSKNKQILDQELSSERIKKIFNILENFFNIKPTTNTIDIYLLAQPDFNYMGGGGANIGKNQMTLEVNKLIVNHSSTEHALGIIFHESCHLVFLGPDIFKMIKKCLKEMDIDPKWKFFTEQIDPLTIVIEIIIETLVPKGYIGKNLLHSPGYVLDNLNPVVNYSDFKKIVSHKMASLVKKYIETKTSIDEKFVFNVVNQLLKIKRGE